MDIKEVGILPLAWPPLHYAAWGGNVEKVKELIEAGADVNTKNEGSETPLDKTTKYNSVVSRDEIISFLKFYSQLMPLLKLSLLVYA